LSEPGLGLKMGQGMRQPCRALRVPGSGVVIQKASITGKSSFHSATSLVEACVRRGRIRWLTGYLSSIAMIVAHGQG